MGQAVPGDRLAYHRGFLAWDLAPELTALTKQRRAALNRLASRARQLSEQGLVHLVQRREGPGDYTYLLVVRRRPGPRGTGGLRQLLAQAVAVPA